jgi:acyl carrier protein
MSPTAEEVRDFVVTTLDRELREGGVDPAQVGDDFDLLVSGVIDSLGVMELIMAVNDHFELDIDFEELDPEGLTVIGPFSRYVAANGGAAPA